MAAHRFPFPLPAIETLNSPELGVPGTVIVHENGPGESMLLDAIVVAAELPSLGSDEAPCDHSLAGQRALGVSLRFSWTRRSRRPV
jgi:predicted ATPase